jgi:serine/threonine-protein kinase
MGLAFRRCSVAERHHVVPRLSTSAEPISRDRSSVLPDDLAAEQSLRIQLFYGVGVALWLINIAMDAGLSPQGDRGPYRLGIESAAAVLSAVTAGFTRFGRAPAAAKVGVALAGIVPHACALALLNSWTAQPTSMRPLSPVTVLILFFGMMAPGRPRPMLVAALCAASMDPVAVWIAHLRGLPVPSPLNTLLFFYPNYVCAVLAVGPARIVYGLASKLRAARAFGSYELVERLGQGGMGEVWRARHCLLARCAAIKLVRPERLGVAGDQAEQMLRRFTREAQATAALTSPHTIRVFDFGLTASGTFYYVMELLDGLDLDSFVRRFGPLPPARALHFLRQVCLSLAEAHARGLVHRDIKPANIFVSRMGLECDFVKVLDFGLVKMDRHDTETAVTAPFVTMGTPGYIAPEAILGGNDSDPAADVYALGCLAYYLLTGHQVFSASSPMTVLLHHVQEAPAPPSARTEQSIPADVDDLVLACLRKDPARRPASAEAVLQMIARLDFSDRWHPAAAGAWWRRHLIDLARIEPVPAFDGSAV